MTAALESAFAKLSGHVVATPLIGGLQLPQLPCPRDLRIKPEGLQIGGGIWFRGAMHELGRHFGSLKGIVVCGTPRFVYATVCAANAQRVPVLAVPYGLEPHSDLSAVLDVADCELFPEPDADAAEARAASLVEERGFARMPGIESEAFADGIATVGMELAEQLPFDTSVVFVAPEELAEPIRRGLKAGGRGCAVRGVEVHDASELKRVADQLRIGARVVSDPEACAALASALATNAGTSPCVVLSS